MWIFTVYTLHITHNALHAQQTTTVINAMYKTTLNALIQWDNLHSCALYININIIIVRRVSSRWLNFVCRISFSCVHKYIQYKWVTFFFSHLFIVCLNGIWLRTINIHKSIIQRSLILQFRIPGKMDKLLKVVLWLVLWLVFGWFFGWWMYARMKYVKISLASTDEMQPLHFIYVYYTMHTLFHMIATANIRLHKLNSIGFFFWMEIQFPSNRLRSNFERKKKNSFHCMNGTRIIHIRIAVWHSFQCWHNPKYNSQWYSVQSREEIDSIFVVNLLSFNTTKRHRIVII